MNDDELHRLLRQYPSRTAVPASFEREVWSRIEAGGSRGMAGTIGDWLARCLEMFARPAAAWATVLVFSAAGLVFGWQQHREDMVERAALAYHVAVNPLYRHAQEVPR